MRKAIVGALFVCAGAVPFINMAAAKVVQPSCILSSSVNYIDTSTTTKTTVIVTWKTQNANGYIIQARDGATHFRGDAAYGSTTVVTNQPLDVTFAALSGSQLVDPGSESFGTYGLCSIYIP